MSVTRLLESNKLFFRLIRARQDTADSRINFTDTAVSMNDSMDIMKDAVVGDYKWSVRSSDFYGWMVCDGRLLSRSEYKDLFDVVGTSFNIVGDSDNTKFRLPDLRGRTACGIGQGTGLSNRYLGSYTGAEQHTLITTEIPSHTHTGTVDSSGSHTHGIYDPGHAHTIWTRQDDYNEGGGNPPSFADDDGDNISTWTNINSSITGITINTAGSHTHTFTTAATGSNTAHNIMQPSAFIGNMFIFSGKYPVTLSALRNWARLAQSSYANLADSYLYVYDGEQNGVHLSLNDGGEDMFNNGNYTYLTGNVFTNSELLAISQTHGQAGFANPRALVYGAEYVNMISKYGVYVSHQNSYPHLVFTFTCGSGTLGIQSFGTTGSATGGSVENYSGTYTCTNGRTGLFWANINYFGGTDPTVGDVWFSITHPDWESSYVDDTTVVDTRKTSDTANYDHKVQIAGQNFAFCKVLLSKLEGKFITATEVEEFLTNYVKAMPLSLIFQEMVTA